MPVPVDHFSWYVLVVCPGITRSLLRSGSNDSEGDHHMEWNEQEAQKTMAELVKRATVDAEFRALALSDPNAAIGKINPTPIPGDFKIRFVDNAGANLTVVLPDPVAAGGELSDAELEQVAGGGGTANRCGGSCAASCVFSSVL
jgi:hypothetical protein